MDFNDKAVLVTGSSSGIGFAIAEGFAAAGAMVGICGVPGDEQRTADACSVLKKKGYKAEEFNADLGDEGSVRRLIEDFIKKFDKIDVLVNNAGIYAQADAEKTELGVWEKILGVNLTGAFLATKYSIPYLKRQEHAAIVNIGSEAGIVGIANQVAYNVSKAGVISLTKSCALDFAKDNIRVNCVCPGTTETPLVEKAVNSSDNPAEARSKLESVRPANRLGRPEEIARAVMMMADEKLAYATGAVFSIDGGYTAQ